MLTAALIDRLTHHAHILNMNGTSFRLKQRLQKKDVTSDGAISNSKEEMEAP